MATPAGVVGPADFRGSWLALLRCTRPCTPGCGACLERFGALGSQLAPRGCRMMVALDEPDAHLDALLARPHAATEGAATVGKWRAPRPSSSAATTLFALIDPEGVVRAAMEMPNLAPLPEAVIRECIDRALGRSASDLTESRSVKNHDTYGCVGWFNYGTPGR